MPALVAAPHVRVEARRAPRFPIVEPVRFRSRGGEWLEGTTVNMSCLGLLFGTRENAPAPATVLDLRVALTTTAGQRGAHVACVGRVVRVGPSPVPGEVLVATTIDRFQIQPAACSEEDLQWEAWERIGADRTEP